MKKKEIPLTLLYFEDHLKELGTGLTKTIFKNAEIIIETANSKGTLQSGMTISTLTNNLNEEIESQLKTALSEIESHQDDMNLKISDATLDEISKKYSDFFVSVYQVGCNNIEKLVLRHVGVNIGENVTNSVNMNTTISRISRQIEAKIKEVKLKNKVKKDAPSIIVSKKALTTSRIALMVSIIAVGIAFYKLLYN
jgi:hypothetical protein